MSRDIQDEYLFTAHNQPQFSSLVVLQLREALYQNQFTAYYQPQFYLASGNLRGIEALARWNHPQKGVITPKYFIGPAKSAHLIAQLSSVVLNLIEKQLSYWIEQDIIPPTISINFSAQCLRDRVLIQELGEMVQRHACLPVRFEIELTESEALDPDTRDIETIASLRKLGIQIAIDDLGNAYSS
ncbi:MAG: EAL domain-containing protein, partial [Oscillospiraceae bacterium]